MQPDVVGSLLDDLVDATPVLAGALPELSNAMIFACCTDIAQRIHEHDVIARRYGFGDEATMAKWVREHPAIRHKIKELRAIWESDDNVEVRLRRLAGHALLDAMPDTAALMFGSKTDPKPSIQLDAMNAHAKVAGVSGPPMLGRNGEGGAHGVGGAGRFSVNINFSNGKVETINTLDTPVPTTIEGEAVP